MRVPSLRNVLAVVGGVGAGVGLMYLLDPKNGEERRTAIKDKAVELTNDVRQSVYTTGSELKTRAQEVISDATSRIPKIGTAPQPVAQAISSAAGTKTQANNIRSAH